MTLDDAGDLPSPMQPATRSRGRWRSSILGDAFVAILIVVGSLGILAAVIAFIASDVMAKTSTEAPPELSLTSLGVATVPVVLAAGTVVYINARSTRRSREAQERADRALDNVSGSADLLGFVRANALQMHAYDLLARRQAARSHGASLVSMFVGLALVGAGVAVAVLAADPVSKIAGAGVTAVGAAVGGYIAKTFLTNSRRATQTAAFYFRQPLVTSYLLTAERLSNALPEGERSQAQLAIVHAALAASVAAQSATLGSPGLDVLPSQAKDQA